MPASEPAPSQSSWRSCVLRGLLLTLNVILLLVFLVQGALVYFLWPDGEIELSPHWLDKVNDQLAKEGLSFKAEQLRFDLRGFIAVRDVTLGFTDGEAEAFSADRILVGFQPWELLIGRFRVDELRILGGEMDCPGMLSPTGVRERVLKNITLRSELVGGNWNIDILNMETAGFRLSMNGQVPSALLRDKKQTDKKDKTDLEPAFQELCRSILETEEKTKNLESPLILIELEAKTRQSLGIHATFQSLGYSLPNGAQVGANLVQAKLTLGNDWLLRASEPAMAFMTDLNWPGYFKSKTAEMLVTLNSGHKGVLEMPENATLFLHTMQAQGLSFDGALAIIDFTQMPLLSIHAGLKHEINWMECYGQLNTDKKSGSLHLNGRWDPGFILGSTAFSEMKELPQIRFTERPHFRAHVSLAEGWKHERTWLQLDSGPAQYEKLKVESLFTNAILLPDSLTLTDMHVRTADYAVSGSYTQNLQTNDYRFLINGTVQPLDISFIVDEEWWDELWKEFSFDKMLPEASLDLGGRYGGGPAHKVMFCKAKLPACVYQGVPLTGASAYIWQKDMRLDIMDLHIESKRGTTLGNLHWQYVPKGEDRLYLSFTAASTMQPRELATLIGPEAEPYGELFTSGTPPLTKAAGLIYGKDSDQAGDLYLNIYANFSEKTLFDDITFGKVALQALSKPGTVTIDDISAKLAGGALSGSALLTDHGEVQKLDLELELKDASLYGLFTDIPPLKEVRIESEEQDNTQTDKSSNGDEKPLTAKEKFAGVLNINFKGSGIMGQLDSFEGAGKLYLRQAHLGRLHLFGGLSRLLDGLGIGFGTVDFTSAKSAYTIQSASLHLPKAEIFGPTARIDANGYYQISQDQLDFILSLYPLGGISVPVVSQVLSVLNPISNTIEVQLKGQLSDPKWTTSFGLMRAITGQQKVKQPSSSTQDAASDTDASKKSP